MIYPDSKIADILNIDSKEKIIIKRRVSRITAKNLPLLFQRLSTSWKDLIYFSKPGTDFSFLAIGKLSVELDQELNFSFEHDDQFEVGKNFPLYVGYQKFTKEKSSSLWNDFHAFDWYIPILLLLRKKDDYYLLKHFIENEQDSFDDLTFVDEYNHTCMNEFLDNARNIDCKEEWTNQVNYFLNAIQKNTVEKVVLARQVVKKLKYFSSELSLHTLEEKYPQCFIYGVKSKNSVFIGASPEKLCSINESVLETEAIAGSSPRGSSEKDDEVFERLLLSDPKELREHFNVVKFIKEKLFNLVHEIQTDEHTSVKKLENIQHLRTGITANLKNEISILDLINALHPTPAVCGYPREEANKLINSSENFDRGIYSGIVGWYDEKMNGEFVVAIRSALIKDKFLYAFAGCGIVEGSNPLSELNETELKLKPILSLFENENTSK